MKKIRAKIIQLIVAFSFIANPIAVQFNALQAVDFGESTDYGKYGLGYVGKVYDDGNSIGFATGGKFNFKLKQRVPQPWFKGKGPSLSAGCGGISFSGGFMSLLNLDQIGEQLKDAGAAFAWGIMLGLVTSLPSIKEVWDTINKWARMIQNLLANACNAGKKLATMAKDTEVGEGVSAAFDSVISTEQGSDSLMSKIQNQGSAITKPVTEWLEGASDWASSSATDSEKRNALSQMVKGVVANTTFSQQVFTSQMVNFNLTPLKMTKEAWDVSSATSGTVFEPTYQKENPNGLSGSDLAEYQFRYITALFLYNYTSSKVFNESGVKSLVSILNKGKLVISGSLSPEAYEKELKEYTTTYDKENSYLSTVHPSSYSSNPEEAIIAWADSGDIDGLKNSRLPLVSGVVYAPNNTDGSNNQKVVSIIGVALKSDGSSPAVKDTGWQKVLEDYGDFETISSKQIDCLKRTATNCSDVLPVLLPDIKKAMYVYSQSLSDDQEGIEERIKWELKHALWKTLQSYMKTECMHLNADSSVFVPMEQNGKTVPMPNDIKEQDSLSQKCEKLVINIKIEEGPPPGMSELTGTAGTTIVPSTFLGRIEYLGKKNIQRGLLNSPSK